MSIIKSLEWRYATKKFDSHKKLSSEQLNTLKKAFNLTATSYGLQPLSLVIVTNPALKQALLPHCFNQSQIIDASHLLVICYPDHFDKNDIEEYFDRVQEIRHTADEIIKPFKDFLIKEFEQKSIEDKHQTFIKQTYIALGNLLNVCALEQIDSCPMEGFIPSKIDEILDLKSKNLKSALLLPVGFRSENDFMAKEKKVRKPLQDIIIEI